MNRHRVSKLIRELDLINAQLSTMRGKLTIVGKGLVPKLRRIELRIDRVARDLGHDAVSSTEF
jgi:hypothetical protein